MRVLVIDDHEDVAYGLRELLECLGADARCAYSGEQALSAAVEFRPDLILCDIAMPAMTGLELVQRLKTYPELSHTHWVAHTGFTDVGLREQCLHAGFERVIFKPMSVEVLLELVNAPVETNPRL